MGRLSVVFKADGTETDGRCSISEWWLDPHTRGHGAHSHPPDDMFFVLEGTLSFLVGEEWVDAPAGSFILVPGGVTHTFDNRGDTRAGVAQHLRARLGGAHAGHRRLVPPSLPRRRGPLTSTRPGAATGSDAFVASSRPERMALVNAW